MNFELFLNIFNLKYIKKNKNKNKIVNKYDFRNFL
jgi:hypothetical protein